MGKRNGGLGEERCEDKSEKMALVMRYNSTLDNRALRKAACEMGVNEGGV